MARLRGRVTKLVLVVLAGCGGSSSPARELAVVLAACNPALQTGCPPGDKCTWLRTTSSAMSHTGAMACTPAGHVAEGGTCHYGADGAATGYDDCQAGLVCRADRSTAAASGSCARICDNTRLTSCAPSDLWACRDHGGFFDPLVTPNAGLCDPQCDPLTQVRLTDGAAACGSPDPANPNLGCYGAPSAAAGVPTVFSCARAALGDMTSDVVIPAPYVNGCAPGYLPLLAAASGSIDTICVALCRPADTTLESHPTPGGIPPSTCAVRGAGGTHECRHWWALEHPRAATSTWSNGLGFCVDYTRYTFPIGGNPATPVPSCTAVSATSHVYDTTITDAAFWGCVATQTHCAAETCADLPGEGPRPASLHLVTPSIR
jgi:hypothetical protein